MKKVISLSMVCLMALSICVVFSCAKNDDYSNSGSGSYGTYVDLGLPSGTNWKASNEKNTADAQYDYFTYDEAVSQFGNSLPTKAQLEELKAECQWSWNGSGYKVTGPNGNYIVLPAAGSRDCREDGGSVDYIGTSGGYWTSTASDSYHAWRLGFRSDDVSVWRSNLCLGFSVRLVQK